MKAHNALTHEFLSDFPVAAARVLERLPSAQVAALLRELSLSNGEDAVAAMLPQAAAGALLAAGERGAELLAELPAASAARIFRSLTIAERESMAGHLPEKVLGRIQRHLRYPPGSAGALASSGQVDVLPQAITVKDALERLGHADSPADCEIYAVDDDFHLTGMVETGVLLTADRHARLSSVMRRNPVSLQVHAQADALLGHPGWLTNRRLPVVDRDEVLVGVLSYSRLRQDVRSEVGGGGRDPMHNLLSLTGLYWVTAAKLLENVLGGAESPSPRVKQGKRP